MPVATKSCLTILVMFKVTKAIFKKIFEEELFIRTLSTTLLQIFCKCMLYSKVIFKNMIIPDDACQVDLGHEWDEYHQTQVSIFKGYYEWVRKFTKSGKN